VELIKMDMQYPVLTPAFHTYLAANPPPAIPNYTINLSHFIGTPTSFYNRLADEIHGRGLDLWIEHSTLFGDFTATPRDADAIHQRKRGRTCIDRDRDGARLLHDP
jgi:hypothetical protein